MIGKLRERITIETPSLTSDGQGGFTESWSTFATRWARVEPLSAGQRYFAQQQEHTVTHKITMRYLDGLHQDMRISFGDRIFQIHSFRDVEERGRFSIVDAEEGVAS